MLLIDILYDLEGRKTGGVIFSTIQKFVEETGLLSDRESLPNATYIAFTGTPIETTDKSTYGVFGDLIDVYDIIA